MAMRQIEMQCFFNTRHPIRSLLKTVFYQCRLTNRCKTSALSIHHAKRLNYRFMCRGPIKTNSVKDISQRPYYLKQISKCMHSEKASEENLEKEKPKKQSGQVAKLAKVFAEYGTIGVVFHTSISLTSLGISYLIVSSGIDVVAIMQKFNIISEVTTEAKVAGGASTLVIAYALHKVFMPVRIFITVSCTPLIVKKLRQIGFLKVVKKTAIETKKS